MSYLICDSLCLDAEHISYTEKRRTFTLILLPIAAVSFLAVFIVVHIKKSGGYRKSSHSPLSIGIILLKQC